MLYVFTHAQAACVKVLWRNFENGTPVISEQTILVESGSLSDHLSDVFEKGRHLSWKTMIVAGEKKGTCRLSETV